LRGNLIGGRGDATSTLGPLTAVNANGDEIADFAGEAGLAVVYACESSAVRR
jgi:hypothetical protein